MTPLPRVLQKSNGRNLIVCIDDTTHTIYDTNVRKLKSVLEGSLEPTERQVVHFVNITFGEAIKNENAAPAPLEMVEFPRDIIKSIYLWLSRTYRPGDYLSIIGGATGAYAARMFAAMLATVGLVLSGNDDDAERAWNAYTACRAAGNNLKKARKLARSYRIAQPGSVSVKVRFLGLWESSRPPSISSSAQFPLISCHDISTYIYHAVALHERDHRKNPDLFVKKWIGIGEQRVGVWGIPYKSETWFVGEHADVIGGRYPSSEPQCSNIPLRSILKTAAYVGIFFNLRRVLNLPAVYRCPRWTRRNLSWETEAAAIDFLGPQDLLDALSIEFLREACIVPAGYDLPPRVPPNDDFCKKGFSLLCCICTRTVYRVKHRYNSYCIVGDVQGTVVPKASRPSRYSPKLPPPERK